MQYLFHCLVLLNYFETTTSNIARVPVIHHVSMSVVNYTSTTINATCNQCLCAMLLNLTMMSSFNCFPQNGTCEIFSSSLKTSALLLLNNSMSSTYFRSLPTDVIAGLTTATNLQSTSVHVTVSVTSQTPPSNFWIRTQNMTVARSKHTSTYIAETDSVLFTGGVGLSSMETYFVSNGSFVRRGNMSVARYTHTADRISTNAVLLAGQNTTDFYDPLMNIINRTMNLNTFRSWHQSSMIDAGGGVKKVLLSGGNRILGVISYILSADSYDSATNSFSLKNMTVSRYFHTSTTLPNGHVLLAGGDTSAGLANNLELYNRTSNTFMNLTVKMSASRYYHTATYIDSIQSILFAGGYNGGNLNTYDLFNVTTFTFVRNGTLRYARCAHTATLLQNGQVLLVGGDLNLNTVELFNPFTFTFTAVANLSVGRGYHTATLLNSTGQVLVCGGEGVSGYLASCELYQPS